MIEWIISNKEWLFSGLGIAVISAIFTMVKINNFKKQDHVDDVGRNKSAIGDGNVIGDKNIIGDGNVVQITNLPPKKKESDIKIVDITVYEDKEFIVDIKLRNIGDQVAYIKEISFNVLDYYNMVNPQITHYQLVQSSNTYDVILEEREQQIFKVSQSIGVNEVDRFQVKIASSIAEARMVTIYYLSLSIIYDEDNKVVQSEKYIWTVPSITKWAGCYVSHTSMELAKKNYFKLKEFNSYDAIKSKHFIDILSSYEKNKSDFLD